MGVDRGVELPEGVARIVLTEVSSPKRRHWFRRMLVGFGALLLALLALYGWALLSTGSSTFARALVWREADVDDLERFPARTIAAPAVPSPLPAGAERELLAPSRDDPRLEELLGDSETSAFVVVHRGRLVYQRYFGGAEADTLQTSFSVAKSFLSNSWGSRSTRARSGISTTR
jgi:hypothetical protein